MTATLISKPAYRGYCVWLDTSSMDYATDQTGVKFSTLADLRKYVDARYVDVVASRAKDPALSMWDGMTEPSRQSARRRFNQLPDAEWNTWQSVAQWHFAQETVEAVRL